MGLKVYSMTEFLASHILLLGGLILFTIGFIQDAGELIIAGVWAFALGVCIGFSAAVKRLMAK
jgi:hypothetical protein